MAGTAAAPAPPAAPALQVTPRLLCLPSSHSSTSLLLPTERFPLQLPMASEMPGVSFTAAAVPPPVRACGLPSVPGLPVSDKPDQIQELPKEPAAVAGLGNNQNSIPSTHDVSALLSALPDLRTSWRAAATRSQQQWQGRQTMRTSPPTSSDTSALLSAH